MARVGGTKYSVFLWFRKKKLQKKKQPPNSNFQTASFSMANVKFFKSKWASIHYAREIWKRSFISTIRPTVHTNPSRKRNGVFRKLTSNWRNLKTLAFRFSVDRKKRSFSIEQCPEDNHESSLFEFSSNMTGNCRVFNFSGVAWAENIWCVFSEKVPLSNLILQRSMERA